LHNKYYPAKTFDHHKQGRIVGDTATPTQLTATSISVGTLTIAANSTVVIAAGAVWLKRR
jgi:hypothetical protein